MINVMKEGYFIFDITVFIFIYIIVLFVEFV